MPKPKRVLCMMDLAVAGRSSLAAVLPVLAACGVQACPLPTMLLSTHTGGFGSPAVQQNTEFCEKALAHFKQQGISFDAVYTGYLQGSAQFALAEAAFAQYPDAFKVADPAMGDNGLLYTGLSEQTAAAMVALCEKADLVTPNFTESALLLGLPPLMEPLSRSGMAQRLQALSGARRQVLVTSSPTPEGGMEIWAAAPGGPPFAIPTYHVPQNYPGTGDLFTAAVTGLVLRGLSLHASTQAAADFVRSAALLTLQQQGEARHGIWFEPFLSTLSLAANSGM
ncbi:MAG: bifunctional hydroxymethylpyrimidine kinase/phosphomethylpyrimidine kinase [Oscillospiraceae bacterium]